MPDSILYLLLALLGLFVAAMLWNQPAPVTSWATRHIDRQFQRAVVLAMGLSVPTAVYLLAWLARYLHG